MKKEAKGLESPGKARLKQPMVNSQNLFLPGAAEENSADGDLDKVSRSEAWPISWRWITESVEGKCS